MMAFAFVVMAFFRDNRYLQIIHLPASAYIVYELICAFFAIGAFVYLFSKYFNKSFAFSKIGGEHFRYIRIPSNSLQTIAEEF